MLTNYGVIDEWDNWTIFCKSVGYRDWTSFEFDEFREGCDVFGKEKKKRKKDEFVQVCGKLIERKRERHEIARRRREGKGGRRTVFSSLSSPISPQHSRLRRHLTSYIYYSPLSYRFSINLSARSALLLSANLSHIRMLSTTYIYYSSLSYRFSLTSKREAFDVFQQICLALAYLLTIVYIIVQFLIVSR